MRELTAADEDSSAVAGPNENRCRASLLLCNHANRTSEKPAARSPLFGPLAPWSFGLTDISTSAYLDITPFIYSRQNANSCHVTLLLLYTIPTPWLSYPQVLLAMPGAFLLAYSLTTARDLLFTEKQPLSSYHNRPF